MKKAIVILAPGAEEMETVIIVDVLRRAEIEVVLLGLEGCDSVLCSRKIRIHPDTALSEFNDSFDALLLPGGAEGARRLAESAAVGKLLREAVKRGLVIGAICAAPIALVSAGVGKGKNLTSHPAVREALEGHGKYSEQRVVKDGLLITSRGPGTAFEFALAVVCELSGKEKAEAVAGPMILPG